jgi:hypothetical protein
MIIKQKFIDQWVIAYNEYYKRTGTVVGDDQTQPTYMVAGLDYNYVYAGGDGTGLPSVPAISGGIIAVDRTSLWLICEGDGHSLNGVESEMFQRSDQRLHELMDRHGIRMPPGRAEGQEDRYVYLDQNGNPQELQICFTWFPSESAHGSGNAMIIRGLTPDLARQLDRMIDGNADALEGRFRQLYSTSALHGPDASLHQQPNREWTGVNSRNVRVGDLLSQADISSTGLGYGDSPFNDEGYRIGGGPGIGGPQGEIRDEDQVMRVTAVYLMDW